MDVKYDLFGVKLQEDISLGEKSQSEGFSKQDDYLQLTLITR